VLYEYGLARAIWGDVKGSKVSLGKALATFEAKGMRLWAARCRKALEGIG
jgi:hypothetical protein